MHSYNFGQDYIVEMLYSGQSLKDIPFYSLLNNESSAIEDVDSQINPYGHGILSRLNESQLLQDKLSEQISTRFKMHPVFSIARCAELSIRRNDMERFREIFIGCSTDSDMEYIDNPGLRGNHLYDELLVLAIAYMNTAAVKYLINDCGVSPDKGMGIATAISSSHMLHLLLENGAAPGRYLYELLQKTMPDMTAICVLLHHGADTCLRKDGTDNNVIYYVGKTSILLNEELVELMDKDNYILSKKQIEELEEVGVPDKKYSIQYVKSTGGRLLQAIGDGSNFNNYVNNLIRESSSDSFELLIDGLHQYIQINEDFMWQKEGHKLLNACLHKNFQVPENIELYSKLITVLKNSEFSELSDITAIYITLQRIGTDEALQVISHEVPKIYSAVYSRLKQGIDAYPNNLSMARYPDVIFNHKVINFDKKGRLLAFVPVDDTGYAIQEIEAFEKVSSLLLDSEKHDNFINDYRARSLIKSLLHEPRFDLDKRGYGSWSINSTYELPGSDWYLLMIRPTIFGLAWICYLYNKKSEWIDELLGDVEYYLPDPCIKENDESLTFSRIQLLKLINCAMDDLWSTDLKGNNSGEKDQLTAIELLTSVGILDIMEILNHQEFTEMWSSIINGYKKQLATDDNLKIEGCSNVADRLSTIVNNNTKECI